MNVTQATPDGGALTSLDGDWVLAYDAATGRFRRRFTFALPTGGLADGVHWQADSGFTLSFPTFDYDAGSAGAPEAVSLADSGADRVRLTFPFARTLRSVKIAGAQAADVLEARRVDGNAVTEDAFVTASHGTGGATLNALDRQLVLSQTRAGAAVALRTTHIQQVIVRSTAANARVGVVLPALGAEVFHLGPDAGAVLTNPAAASNLGPALAVLLQGACDRLAAALDGALLPASLPMTLVIETDTPSRAHVAGFVLRYRLVRRRFADLAPKRVIEFPGDSLVSRPLAIDVPRGTSLWSATLRMMGPFREADENGTGGTGSGGGAEAPPVVHASDLGIELRPGQSAAARVTLQQAMLIEGAILDVAAITDGSAGRVQMHLDAGGSPGEALGRGSLPAIPPGARRGARVDFDRASVASAGPVWVTVHCDGGRLLWLTAAPGDEAPRGALLRRSAGEAEWTAVGAAADRPAVVSFVPAAGAPGPGAALAPGAFHGVRLHLGGVRLRGGSPPPGSAGEKETRFGLASVLAPLLQSAPSGSLVPVSLSLISSDTGRVTVYPPEFEFDP